MAKMTLEGIESVLWEVGKCKDAVTRLLASGEYSPDDMVWHDLKIRERQLGRVLACLEAHFADTPYYDIPSPVVRARFELKPEDLPF